MENVSKQKLDAALKLLRADSTSLEKLESLKDLISCVNPKVDRLLVSISKNISLIKKVQEGDAIALSLEKLPEGTEKEKKRKKLAVAILKYWRELEAEVERIDGQFAEKGDFKNTDTLKNVLSGAKGPFGVVTFIALAVVAVTVFASFKVSNKRDVAVVISTGEGGKVQYIEFQGEKIPLDLVEVRSGPDCDRSHYHAKNNSDVTSISGLVIKDLGGCAFGKVDETAILVE